MKTCLGCNTEYEDDIWLHKELGICSKCYHIHIHSKYKKWNGKKWIENIEELIIRDPITNEIIHTRMSIRRKIKKPKESLEKWLK